MGKKSVRENKNIYQIAREEAGFTRAKASEVIGVISESAIEKIEYNQMIPAPDYVLAMAKAYGKPELCNNYCAHECPIGNVYVPEVTTTELSQIVLHLLASLNTLERDKDRLIEITVDGKISENELKDFARIQKTVNQISLAADAMQLWLEKGMASGVVDKERLNILLKEMD